MAEGFSPPGSSVNRGPQMNRQRASHVRSASWSHTTGNGQIHLSNLSPITSVIREFVVPSFGNSGRNSSHVTRTASPRSPTTYVDLSQALGLDSGINRSGTRLRNESGRFLNQTSNSGNSSDHEEPGVETGNTGEQQGNGNGRNPGDRMEFQGTISWLERSVPFVLLLLSRIMWDHRLGILVFIGLCGTFLHANNTVKRQVSLKDRRLYRISLWTFLFLSGNVFFIYYVFYNQQLENCLLFRRPNFHRMDVWTVFWCVGITDFVIRLVSMALKSAVVVMHTRIIPFRKRGKYYMLLEHLSQFYRMLIPIPLWFAYFTDYNYGGEYFAFIATSVYLVLKGRMLFGKVKELHSAYQTFRRDVQYGSVPSKDHIAEAGNSCPICQEELAEPIMLTSCKHIFCEDCISLWFDREQTCPMCRAKVVGDPTWRDGSTAAYVQLF